MPPPPPPPLPDELVEEVFLRLAPENPAGLVRAGLVCRRWCRLVSDPGFRRRFREFHRRPPVLGMLCRFSRGRDKLSRFIPTTAFCNPRTDFPGLRVLDARHGRVLGENGRLLVVWDPITDAMRHLPFPQKLNWYPFAAAVLCAAAAGACNHLDCHPGPFLVVFVCATRYGSVVVYTYSSDVDAWIQAVGLGLGEKYIVDPAVAGVLVGSALYFWNAERSEALKCDLELRQLSLIRVPSLPQRSLLTTAEDGGLGLVYRDGSKLYMWSTKDTREVDAKWETRVTIELTTVFPACVGVTNLCLIGSLVGTIFMRTRDEIYSIDLETFRVKKVYEGTGHPIVPYMSFYTPVLRVATTGEGLSAGTSTAEQA